MMELIPYNKEQTKRNVEAELKEYRRNARLADERFIPNVTATYSFEMKSFTGKRPEPVENYVTRHVDAVTYLTHVVAAMNKLNAYKRQILWAKYCDRRERNDKQIYMDLHIPERTYYRGLDAAIQEFAEAYENGRLLAE